MFGHHYIPTIKQKNCSSMKGSLALGCPKWFNAVYSGDLDYIKKHIKNVNMRDRLGQTALHHASIAGRQDVVQLLIESGVDVDSKGIDKSTALRCATQEGHLKIVQFLLGQGASIHDKDEDGLTVLHCAANEGHTAIVRLLLTKVPYLVNQQSLSGWAALHLAAVMGHGDTVKLLIDYGADLRLSNNQGKTAGDLAKERAMTDVSRTIEKALQSLQRLRQESQEGTSHSEAGAAAVSAAAAAALQAKEDSEIEKKLSYVRVLECPVCLDLMKSCKIYQCVNGHNVCEACRANPALTGCPQCRLPYHQPVRNLGLEELARMSFAK